VNNNGNQSGPKAWIVRAGEDSRHAEGFAAAGAIAIGWNDIPGAPGQVLATEIRYSHPSGFSLTPSVEWIPQAYFVDSQNTIENNGWTNLSLRAEWSTSYGMTVFAAGQNLTNRNFSQSVQVDNAAGKFFEPADGRSFYAGLRWSPR